MRQFGIGQAVARVEDRRLTRGAGRFIDDIELDGQAHAVFVRSPHAHADIAGIDRTAAAAMPGVLGVFTGEDLAADGVGDVPCIAPVKNADGSPYAAPPRPALARGRVRHVGDAVAAVVAETRAQALDAAERIEVGYAPRQAVTGAVEALAEGAPRVWDEAPGNRCFRWRTGDAEGAEAALAAAKRVVELELVNNRVVPSPMETRGALAAADGGRLTLHVSCQGVHLMRSVLAGRIFHCPEKDIRVLCHDVGGGFGMKIFLFPEYVAVLYAARRLGRPVKWISERGEAFASDSHGRDHVTRLRLALDGEARITGLHARTVANLGAYLSNYSPFVATEAGAPMLVGCYTIPVACVEVEGAFTNTVPVDAYRGAGRPEAIYAIERLLDAAALEFGIGPDEIRRRNLIPAEAMPFATAMGSVYDSGDFAANLELALSLARWSGFPARREEARARGRLRGIGLACYVERCAGGAAERARVTVDGKGRVVLRIGTQSNGQGHETAFRQILVERLGVDFEDIEVVQGDTDRVETGGGTGGSRSVPVGGAAVRDASDRIVEKASETAADMLEADAADIEFGGGKFRVAGTDRILSFAQVAAAAADGGGDAFDEIGSFAPDAPTYPNGVHVCELEIDPRTGTVDIADYTVVDDFGTVLNPELLMGQVHGGIAQGVGQALLERCAYEADSGQLLSASFMDYAMPRADHLPMIRFRHNPTPCATNPLGLKGAGEAGAIGAPPAVVNAAVDALSERGVRHLDMPLTPDRIWRALEQGGRG